MSPAAVASLLEQIQNVCRQVILKMDATGVGGIGAIEVAQLVARKIDPSKRTATLMYFGAVQGIAQIARPLLRKNLGEPDDDAASAQIDAFGSTLQERYSIKRTLDDGTVIEKYWLRHLISKREIEDQVIPMLEKRRDSYQRHLRMLIAWNSERAE